MVRVVAAGNTSNAAPVSVGQLRSVAAMLLSLGATPAELDGVIDVLYEPDRYDVPLTFQDMANQALDAIAAYREQQVDTIDAVTEK